MNNLAPTAKTPLPIAVIGVGKIGSTFAYQLARAGYDVTVIARPDSLRLQQLQRDQGIILKTGERAEVRVADKLDEEAAYPLILVTTPAHQVDAVLPALQRSKAQCVQFMFLTFEPERLTDAIGSHRCSFGMPAVMVMTDSEGRIKPTIISSLKTLHGDQRWADLFSSAGIPSAFEPDMSLWLRCEAPLTAATQSIAVAGQRRGGGATWAEAKAVARGLHGGFAIVKGLGYRLYPSKKSMMYSVPNFLIAFLLWVLSRIPAMRENLATGLNECRALIDTMVAAAAKTKPPLPEAAKALIAIKPTEESGIRLEPNERA
jgi:2-dehydropantoate 2-reductase